MRIERKFAFLIMLFGMILPAAEFSLQLLNCPKEVVLGCPIYVGVRVKYLGREPLVIAKGNNGFEINLGAYREDGKTRKCIHPKQLEKSNPIPYHQFETLQPGWEREFFQDISKLCEDEKGILLAWASVSAHGPFCEKRENMQREERKAWEGNILSTQDRILITEPSGVDLEAFKAYSGYPFARQEELLEKYPTSTYTGWALLNYRPDLPGVLYGKSDKEKLVSSALSRKQEDINYYWFTERVPPDEKRDSERRVAMQKMVHVIEGFVSAHPEFPFSGYLLAAGGFKSFVLGDFNGTCKMLKSSLTLSWQLPQASEEAIKKYKEGTEYVLGILQKEGKCK
jgi:hypothetical protein